MQAVIDFKWKRFAKRMLLVQLGCFLLWLGSFSAFLAAHQDEDPALSLKQLLGSFRGAATVAMNAMALVAMMPFLVMEAATALAYGKGWLSAWNFVDLATYILQVGGRAAFRCGSPGEGSALCGVDLGDWRHY
jgi:hypothetical protein